MLLHCMAGHVLCSHAGSFMWRVEYAVRNNFTGSTCTDTQATCNSGATRNVTPSATANIHFKKLKRDGNIVGTRCELEKS